MSVLENLFVYYFYSFLSILPFSLALKTIILLIGKDKKDFLGKKNMALIISFVTVNLLITIGILLTIVFYNKIYELIGEIMTYFLFFGIVVIAYGIISYLESIIATPQKYMKIMSSNIKMCEFKDNLLLTTHNEFLKIYIFVAYIVAIILFQFERLEIYTFQNIFLKNIMTVCNNSISVIVAIELITAYKKQRVKVKDFIKEGILLFDNYFDFLNKYVEVFLIFNKAFEPLLNEKGKTFISKLKTVLCDLQNRLEEIKNTVGYDVIKVSPVIKTYNIFFDTFAECINNYANNKNKVEDKKYYIANMSLYFQEIIENEIIIKSKKSFLKNVCRYINKKANKNWKGKQ